MVVVRAVEPVVAQFVVVVVAVVVAAWGPTSSGVSRVARVRAR